MCFLHQFIGRAWGLGLSPLRRAPTVAARTAGKECGKEAKAAGSDHNFDMPHPHVLETCLGQNAKLLDTVGSDPTP